MNGSQRRRSLMVDDRAVGARAGRQHPLLGYLVRQFGGMTYALLREGFNRGGGVPRLPRNALVYVCAAFTLGLVLGSRLADRRTIRRP